MTTTTLSPETLERLARFVEVFEEFDAFRASLPEEEQFLVRQFDPRVLYIEAQDTGELPVVTVASIPGEAPADTPDPVPDGVNTSAPSPAKKEGRGRPKKQATVQ